MPASIFGRNKGRVAEGDPVQARAIHDALSQHAELMNQGHELFHRVADSKKQSLRYAIELSQKGYPLMPSLRHKEDFGSDAGVYDNHLHVRHTASLTSKGPDVYKYLSKLQAHQRNLQIAEDFKQKETEAAQMLIAMEKAYEWTTRYERDTDAVGILRRLRFGKEGFKSAARREEETTRLHTKLRQVQNDMTTLL